MAVKSRRTKTKALASTEVAMIQGLLLEDFEGRSVSGTVEVIRVVEVVVPVDDTVTAVARLDPSVLHPANIKVSAVVTPCCQ